MTARSMSGAAIRYRPDGQRGSKRGAVAALGDLTWPEVEELAADGAVLAVPVGATEQHGPLLPMTTDTDVVMALAARLAARRRDVIVAPPVGYGSSSEHSSFAGAISIGWDTLELMLVELGRSAAETFRHVLFLSVHGGNDGPVIRATNRLRAESYDVVAWMPGHHPALVPAEAVGLAAAADSKISPAAVTGPSSSEDRPDRAFTVRSGRDPAGASADEGAELLRWLESQLLSVVSRWLQGMPEPL
jgi:creatinine amidohydrolase